MFRNRYFSKRVKIIYSVILLWVFFGVLAAFYTTDWTQVSWYFASLTTYVGAYITSETLKKSDEPTTYLPKSKREMVVYISILMWLYHF